MKILKNLLSLLLGVGQKETLEDMLKKAPFRTVLFFLVIVLTVFLTVVLLIVNILL